jgi:hypothetical protein
MTRAIDKYGHINEDWLRAANDGDGQFAHCRCVVGSRQRD